MEVSDCRILRNESFVFQTQTVKIWSGISIFERHQFLSNCHEYHSNIFTSHSSY